MTMILPILEYKIDDNYHLSLYEDGTTIINSFTRIMKGRAMSPAINGQGYLHLTFAINKRPKSLPLHRMIAEAVYGKCPRGYEVNHKDGNKLNNHPDNLEYVTHKENLKHAVETGLYKTGSAHHNYIHGLTNNREWQLEYWKQYSRKRAKRLTCVFGR